MIKHKQALYEIFEAARQPGQSLENYCEVVLKSAGSLIPEDKYDFIALGDFTLEDIVTGDLKDKFVVIYQDILCGSVVKVKDLAGEVDSEGKACELARLVRTLLKANRTLVSTTYPTGAAKSSSLFGMRSDAVVYGDSQAHVVVVSLRIKTEEVT
jgi:hypothetical protein